MHCSVVKREVSFSSYIPLIIIMAITLILAVLSAFIYIYIPLVVLVAGIILTVYLAPRFLKTEYEYSIEGDIFSVSLIRNKASRKELFSAEISQLVSCTLYTERDKGPVYETINATVKENTAYYAIFSEDERLTSVAFSPSDSFMKDLKLLAPLKVKLNII